MVAIAANPAVVDLCAWRELTPVGLQASFNHGSQLVLEKRDAIRAKEIWK